MKKILLIALLLVPFLGISQTTKPIDGFLGIKFGTGKAELITRMKARGARFDPTNSNATLLSFTNVKLGSRQAAAFFVNMVDDKAYLAIFMFKPEDEPKTIEYYNALVHDIDDIYGPGRPTKVFKSPFQEGDGNEIEALEGGYADMHTDWKSDSKAIQAIIKHNKQQELSVVLTYGDHDLAKIENDRDKAKEKSDY